MRKLSRFWRKDKICIPQPFRLIKGMRYCEKSVMEFMDLSLKKVLSNGSLIKVQNGNGKGAKEKAPKLKRESRPGSSSALGKNNPEEKPEFEDQRK